MSEKKLWGGRFNEKASSIMERIGESISFDHKLFKQDIKGSKAHAKNLLSIGIINEDEFQKMVQALSEIELEIQNGEMEYRLELEDIHMHIEARLTEKIGEIGKKLHTARSRNDQVAQDVRLYISDSINQIEESIHKLQSALIEKAESVIDIIMPGYTHLQVAQPIRASQYFLSYFWALKRDKELFQFAKKTTDVLVLGSGALAGVNYLTNRELIANELNLEKISENSIDAVSQRDHLLQYLFACSQTLIHLSRISEEIILYSSVEFSFISLPDSLTTGSSIMPQKKNPDIAELIRGKSGRVIGNLNHILTLLKGLPLAYNRDLQEDKVALFDSEKQILISLEGITELVKGMKLHPENMQRSLANGFATATDLADYLVNQKQIPFRIAHELVGNLVQECVRNKSTLFDIPEKLRTSISEYFIGEEYFHAISLELSADKKNVFGGTEKNRQLEQISLAKKSLTE
ncbi:MAG: argininosuccinate lyase [Leptospiraceae bacterium]|nr:argininosuccinate lyase [Leptospiraceae bacterium]